MRAAVLRAFDQPLTLTEVAEPEPGPDEIVVAVKAVGLCGTDLKLRQGSLGGTPLPLIPGHEVSGVVAAVGAKVTSPAVGDRVACYMYRPCGECRHCRAGQKTLCPSSTRLGFERDGGFAQLARLRGEEALPISTSTPFAEAAVTMDAVVSAWRAVKRRGAVRGGDMVAIVGAGGLGLSALSIARHLGARVAAVDRDPQHLELARQRGAEVTALPERTEPAVRDWSGGGVDVAVEMSGSPVGFTLATRMVRPGGRVVTVGYAPGRDYGIESAQLVLGEVTIVGSRAGTPEDAREALQAVEQGQIAPPPVARTAPLEALNDGYLELDRGTVLGRLVFVP